MHGSSTAAVLGSSWAAEPDRDCMHAHGVRSWAMLGVAGILAQEITHPEQFWYTSGAEVELPFNILGLLAFEVRLGGGRMLSGCWYGASGSWAPAPPRCW